MMLASGWAASATAFAASLTSHSDRSSPAVIDRRIERAPSMLVSSSGDETAARAASTARSSPWPMPMPSSAFPASDMIVRTSAKSRLMRPGSVTRSETPWTPWRSTSSATRKASTIDVCLSSTLRSRLFGTTMRVSTSSWSSSTPTSAAAARREPSKPKGFVTMPTVSAPTSRAMRATTGAAPVPVPPPAPAAMNTMSLPFSSDLMRSYSSMAAWRPRSGLAPAPSPRVTCGPMCSVTSAVDCCRDCRSVLTARNSTPSTCASTMRLTAFTPAPPTPTTRSTGCPTGLAVPHGVGSSATREYGSRPGSCRGAGGWRMLSGMSALKAWRRRSCAVGTCGSGAGGASGGAPSDGSGASVSRGCGGGGSGARRSCAAGVDGAGTRPSSASGAAGSAGSAAACSVLRNRSASGPSRMLARLPLAIGENLLREIAIGLGGHPVRIVLEHRHAFHRGLREADGLLDARGEDAIPEVLLEDLDRLLGVNRPGVHQRGQDALDLDVGVQVLADHLKRVLQLDQAAHRQVLALDGHDDLVGRRQRVDGEQPEAGRRVDADEVVVVGDELDRLLERALAADHGAHRDLGPGEVDRRAGHVDLALAHHLADRGLMHENVVHRLVQGVGVDPLRHHQVALRVHVDAEDAKPLLHERDGQIERRRRLGDAALLVRESDDLRLMGCLIHVSAVFARPWANPSRGRDD